MGKALVICDCCKNKFLRKDGQYYEAIKMGWRQFCSRECLIKSRTTKITAICTNPLCRKQFFRAKYQASKSKLLFCSTSCSTSYYNAIRQNIVQLRKCERANCSNYIHHTNLKIRFCCGNCARVNNRGFTSYSPKITVDIIQTFVKKHDRIPTKNELGYLNRSARRFFGTWNKAIIASGYEPNPVMFAKHYQAIDGHGCDSLAEKIVDDWLYRREIKHQINVPYPWNNGMTADFVVDDNWVEIFGLSGEHKKYDALKKMKLKLAQKYDIAVIKLTLKDVYRGNLERKLVRLVEKPRHPS